MNNILRSRLGILSILTAGLVIFVVIIWLLFGGSAPSPTVQTKVKIPPIQLPIVSSGATFADVSIPGQILEIPPEMVVYLRSNPVEATGSAKSLATQLGMGEGKYIDQAGLYVWSKAAEELSFDPNNGSLVYTKPIGKLDNFRSDVNTELSEIAKNYLVEAKLDKNVGGESVSWMKSVNGESGLMENFGQANVGVVSFGVQVNGYGVYSQTGSEISQNVWVGSDKEIYKASLMTVDLTNSQKTVQIIPVSQVVSQLVNGGGKIVKMNGGIKSGNFAKLMVDQMQIGYLLDLDSQILQPIYIIKGMGYIESNSPGIDMVIYVQAIKND